MPFPRTMTASQLSGVSMHINGDPNGDDCVKVELSAVMNSEEIADVEAWVESGGILRPVPLDACEYRDARAYLSRAWYLSQRD